jgi:phosphosulfolactate synthase (CoM biosynthesis protein A)
MGIADEAFPNIAFDLVKEQDFDLALGVLFDPDETGGDDLGVVANQDIARLQIVDDIVKTLVLNRLLFPVDHHETAFIALLNWGLGNQLFRERKIK